MSGGAEMPKWDKSLTIGILFLTFSLTLFDISSPGWVIRYAAEVFFGLSICFLIKVLHDVTRDLIKVLHDRVIDVIKVLCGGIKNIANVVYRIVIDVVIVLCEIVKNIVIGILRLRPRSFRLRCPRDWGTCVWENLRILMIAAFLTGYGLALGRGTAQMEPKSLEGSVVVVGIIWFFIVFLALPAVPLAAAFPQKAGHKASVLIVVTSLGFLIYGIVLASTAADQQGLYHGIYLALFGFTLPISLLARHTLARYSPF
jgi:hypothetical protein